jgi:hypothetical protein
LNLVSGVELDVREQMPGYGGLPVIVDAGCGHAFEVPNSRVGWDVNTEIGDDGIERVIETHRAYLCPACGRLADHVIDPIEPTPVDEYAAEIRDIFLSGVMGDALLDQTPEEVREMLWRGLPAYGDVFLKGVDGLGIPRLGVTPSGGADAGYSHVTEGAIALAAATAKSIIGFKAGSAVGLSWTGLWIGFDGVTASAVPVLLEACACTFATNSPGTNSTGTTEQQTFGRASAADWTGGRNWTAEPTVIAVIGEGLLSPNGGVIWYDDPLGREADCDLSKGFVIRTTAPAIVNVRATQKLRHS